MAAGEVGAYVLFLVGRALSICSKAKGRKPVNRKIKEIY